MSTRIREAAKISAYEIYADDGSKTPTTKAKRCKLKIEEDNIDKYIIALN